MTRLWENGVAVDVVRDGWNRPLNFVWQGRLHRIETIRQAWTVDSDWWSEEGRVWRDYFALTTSGGLLCVVYHDWLADEWRLAKVYD